MLWHVLDQENIHWGVKNSGGELTPSGDLLTSSSNTDDNALTPALVAGLESSAHDPDVTSTVEGIITATISHLNQVLLNGLAGELSGVNEVGSAELASPGLFSIIDINSNDHTGLVLDRTLHNRQTNTADTEDSDIAALLDLGSHDSSTVTGGDTAAEQTGPISRDLRSDRDDRDIGHDGVLGEGGGAHEVQEVLAAGLETGGTIRHNTLTLGSTDFTTEVRLARLAELALAAFRGATIVSGP